MTQSSAEAPSAVSKSSAANEQAVLNGYMGFFNVGLTTGGKSESEIRELMAPYGTAEMINRLVSAIVNLTAAGQIPAGTVTFNEPQVTITGATARVIECRDSSTEQIVHAQTGQVVHQGNPLTKYDAELVLGADGLWRVAEYDVEVGTC